MALHVPTQNQLPDVAPMQAPWIYNVDPDQLFVKPLVAPGPAEGTAPALGYFYPNVNPEHPPFKVCPVLAAVCGCACKLMHAGMGALA